MLIGTFTAGSPRKEPGYWILPGTPEGPATEGRSYLPTADAGSG